MALKLSIKKSNNIWSNGKSQYFGYCNSDIEEISKIRNQPILDIDGLLSIFVLGLNGQNVAISVDPLDEMNPNGFPEVYIDAGQSEDRKQALEEKINKLTKGLFIREG